MSYQTYYPEMNEAKPVNTIGRASLAHYGQHYFIDTRLVLKGRGITHTGTLTANDLVPSAQHRIGEHTYKVTLKAFEKLCEQYDFSGEILLD